MQVRCRSEAISSGRRTTACTPGEAGRSGARQKELVWTASRNSFRMDSRTDIHIHPQDLWRIQIHGRLLRTSSLLLAWTSNPHHVSHAHTSEVTSQVFPQKKWFSFIPGFGSPNVRLCRGIHLARSTTS
jgi:hypothetical protein